MVPNGGFPSLCLIYLVGSGFPWPTQWAIKATFNSFVRVLQVVSLLGSCSVLMWSHLMCLLFSCCASDLLDPKQRGSNCVCYSPKGSNPVDLPVPPELILRLSSSCQKTGSVLCSAHGFEFPRNTVLKGWLAPFLRRRQALWPFLADLLCAALLKPQQHQALSFFWALPLKTPTSAWQSPSHFWGLCGRIQFLCEAMSVLRKRTQL